MISLSNERSQINDWSLLVLPLKHLSICQQHTLTENYQTQQASASVQLQQMLRLREVSQHASLHVANIYCSSRVWCHSQANVQYAAFMAEQTSEATA